MRLRKIAGNGREAVRRRQPLRGWSWAWLVALCLPAQADGLLKVEWDGDGRYLQTVQIAKDKAVEACVVLSVDTAVAWRFESSQPLDFNIHHHVGKKVIYAAALKAGTRGAGELKPTTPEQYCWMWQASGAKAAQLSFELQRR